MKNLQTKTLKEKVSFINPVLKGSLMALSISLISILIFAFVLRFCEISDNLIKPINQVIKTLSILFGVFYGLKQSKEMGLVSGLVIGFLYTFIAFLVFSILDGNFSFNVSLVNDLMFGSIIGAIAGIIAVNLKKK